MTRFAYGIRGSLPCHPGGNWCQAMAQPLDGGDVTMSRRFEGDDADTKANEAIQYHHKNGHWPREAEQVSDNVCQACGRRVVPEGM